MEIRRTYARTGFGNEKSFEKSAEGARGIGGVELILSVKALMLQTKYRIRDNYKFYSQDLLNNLFKHPYTKTEFLMQDLKVSRITAANYLNKLAEDDLLDKKRIGKGNY